MRRSSMLATFLVLAPWIVGGIEHVGRYVFRVAANVMAIAETIALAKAGGLDAERLVQLRDAARAEAGHLEQLEDAERRLLAQPRVQ